MDIGAVENLRHGMGKKQKNFENGKRYMYSNQSDNTKKPILYAMKEDAARQSGI